MVQLSTLFYTNIYAGSLRRHSARAVPSRTRHRSLARCLMPQTELLSKVQAVAGEWLTAASLWQAQPTVTNRAAISCPMISQRAIKEKKHKDKSPKRKNKQTIFRTDHKGKLWIPFSVEAQQRQLREGRLPQNQGIMQDCSHRVGDLGPRILCRTETIPVFPKNSFVDPTQCAMETMLSGLGVSHGPMVRSTASLMGRACLRQWLRPV